MLVHQRVHTDTHILWVWVKLLDTPGTWDASRSQVPGPLYPSIHILGYENTSPGVNLQKVVEHAQLYKPKNIIRSIFQGKLLIFHDLLNLFVRWPRQIPCLTPGLAYTKTGNVSQDLHVEHPRWLNPKPRKDEKLRVGLGMVGGLVNGCVWKCCVPHCTQWFCWSFFLWKWAIGNINPTFSDKPKCPMTWEYWTSPKIVAI